MKYLKNKNKVLLAAVLTFVPLVSRAADLPNPLKADDVPTLVSYMVRGLLGISGAIALLMLVWGGITWMTSSGNAERVKRGRDTIVWAIFGLIAIFMSYAIINFLFETALAQ